MKHPVLALFILFVINVLPARAQQNADSVYLFTEQPPVFPGGTDKMLAFITANTHYPQPAADSNIECKVMIKMIVDKSGNIKNAAIYRSVHPALDSEALAMVHAMPIWKPAYQNGRVVNAWYYLPVNFAITKSSTGNILSHAEVFPAFPGGSEKLFAFISKQARYPFEAIRQHISGQVLVRFVIDESGAVTSPQLVKSVAAPLDSEALRIVRLMPAWRPGTQQGKTVKVYMTVPVTFRLPDVYEPQRALQRANAGDGASQRLERAMEQQTSGPLIHSTGIGGIVYPR